MIRASLSSLASLEFYDSLMERVACRISTVVMVNSRGKLTWLPPLPLFLDLLSMAELWWSASRDWRRPTNMFREGASRRSQSSYFSYLYKRLKVSTIDLSTRSTS